MMRKSKYKGLSMPHAWIMFFFWPILIWANLSLELTQGTTAAIPISIEVASGIEEAGLKKRTEDIRTVIVRDMAYTNKIRVIDAQLNDEADFAVVIEASSEVKNTICMKVLDNYQKNKQVIHSKCLPVSWGEERGVAHHFADALVKEILGEQSIFLHKIAHVRESHQDIKGKYTLRVSDFDGGRAKIIAKSDEPIMSPSFSPDGKQIAYVSFEDGKSSIYVQSLSKGSRTLLADYPGINGAPAWSPSGKEIALVLSISGVAKLYEIDLQSKNIKKLTSGWYMDTEPSYSRDGQDIIFTSNRGGSPQIYKMHRQTEEVTQLTNDGVYNVSASIAEDNQWIAFLTRLSAKLQVATLDLQSKELSWVGSGQYDDTPKVSPRSDFILYATNKGKQGVLEVMTKDGSIRQKIIEPGASLKHPAWMPLAE